MEHSRMSSTAQLATWEQSMKANQKAEIKNISQSKQSAPSNKLVEDEYEDEFEAYDEDFEDEEPVVAAPAKKVASLPASTKPIMNETIVADSKRTSESKFIQPERQAKGQPKTQKVEENVTVPSTKSRNNFDKMSISLAGTFTDHRAHRVQRLLQSNVMDLQSEKFKILYVPPSTAYDLYMDNIRAANPQIKQTAAPLDSEKRDMECNTDEIIMVDKSMQFTFTDDTDLLAAMDKVKRKKKQIKQNSRGESKYSDSSNDTEDLVGDTTVTFSNHSIGTSTRTDQSTDTDLFSSGTGSKLSTFLRRSVTIFDALLKDSEESKHGDNSTESSWSLLGTAVNNSSSNIIGKRQTAMIRYCETQNNLLLSAHPYKTDDDINPFKGLYCVWDTKNPTSPTFTLAASGQPTCCAFSTTQSHIVLAGTAEGTLHLWDLREDVQGSDRSAIRNPSFSTLLDLGLLHKLQNSANSGDDCQHICSILHIASLSSTGSTEERVATTSQFVTLDESGLVCFWITSYLENRNVDSHASKYGISPWGRVMLTQTRHIQLTSSTSPSVGTIIMSTSNDRLSSHRGSSGSGQDSSRRNGGAGGVIQSTSQHHFIMSVIPGDASTILVSCDVGEIKKVARFGEASAPVVLKRHEKVVVTLQSGQTSSEGKEDERVKSRNNNADTVTRHGNEIAFTSSVTSIAVREQSVSSSSRSVESTLVLVGRENGTVDLFQMNCETPLISWNLGDLKTIAGMGSKGNKKSSSQTTDNTKPCIALKWYTHKDSVFFILDASGCLFIFDIAISVSDPIHVEELLDTASNNGTEVNSQCVDISYSDPIGINDDIRRNSTGTINIAFYVNKTLKMKRIPDSVLYSNKNREKPSSSNREADLRAALTNWSSQTYTSQLVSFPNV